jgi:hypothetical protein
MNDFESKVFLSSLSLFLPYFFIYFIAEKSMKSENVISSMIPKMRTYKIVLTDKREEKEKHVASVRASERVSVNEHTRNNLLLSTKDGSNRFLLLAAEQKRIMVMLLFLVTAITVLGTFSLQQSLAMMTSSDEHDDEGDEEKRENVFFTRTLPFVINLALSLSRLHMLFMNFPLTLT